MYTKLKNKFIFIIAISLLLISLTSCKKISICIKGDNIVYLGETLQLEVSSEDYEGPYRWISGDEGYLLVSDNGLVTPLDIGTIKVTVKTTGKKEISTSIEITILPKRLITISGLPNEILVGDGFDLSASYSIDPKAPLAWTASNDNIIISEEGHVEVLKKGQTTITVTLISNDKITQTIDLNIEDQPAIMFDIDNLEMVMNQTFKLNYSLKGNPNKIGQIKFIPSNKVIVNIDENGIVKAKGFGEVEIKIVSMINEDIYDTVKINVVNPKLNAYIEANEVYVGDNVLLLLDREYIKETEQVTYNSTNKEIATIDENGMITALTSGVTYIQVTLDSNKSVKTTYTLNVLNHLLDLDEYVVEFISTGPGEDASTQMEINYHTYNTKTSVEYVKASINDFAYATKVTGSGYYFDYHGDLNDTPTAPRNVYRVTLQDLEPNCEYYYRINQGNDTYSTTYHFKTAMGKNNDTSILFLADVHYSTLNFDYSGSEVSEKVIQSALLRNPNINLIVSAGDLIDTGGNPAIWDIFYERANSMKNMLWSTVPGNHEYYFSGTSFTDYRFFKAFSASCYNGPSTHIGSSCWYIYNDVLFIMVDNNLYTAEQNAWIEAVLANSTAKWSVVCLHSPVERDNTDRDEKLLTIFERYSVDLVLEGHYHSDCFHKNYFEGSYPSDAYLGVTYLTGDGGGVKGLGDNSQADTFAKGYIIDITDNMIKITRIDALGNVISTKTVDSKKNAPVNSKSKDELINSFNYLLDEEANTLKFSWQDFYGNVKKITFTDNYREEIKGEVFIPTPAYTNKTFKNVMPGYNYNITVTIEFMDGTIEKLNYEIIRSVDMALLATNIKEKQMTLNFTPNISSLDWEIKAYNIYINEVLYDSIYYLDSDFVPISSYLLDNLSKNTTYEIKVEAVTYEGGIVYGDTITVTTK